MNKQRLLLCCSLLMLAAAVHAQTPEKSPLLTGGGKQSISPQVVEAIRALVLSFALPADSARLWMLRRDGTSSAGQRYVSPCIDAYLWPQVFTPRLIRGSAVCCTSDPKNGSLYPESPIVSSWSLVDRRLISYALVAPPDRPFTTASAFERPFRVSGEWSDEDLLAVADAMALVAPEQRIEYVEMSIAGHATVNGQGAGKMPDGHHYDSLEIEFEKGNAGWRKTKVTPWVD